MANFETENGATRDDLMQRVALMEAMIAEGRETTARYGWFFLMWGLLYIAAVGWMLFLPFPKLAWPVCIGVGIIAVVVSVSRRKRVEGFGNLKSRSVSAVWTSMGAAITLFVVAASVSHHWETACFAAILFFIGLAHCASAMILRWGVQGLAAAVWLGCGVACFFFTTSSENVGIFLAASFFGNVLFGAYVMTRERRRAGGAVERHA
jgi:hypothetical protein